MTTATNLEPLSRPSSSPAAPRTAGEASGADIPGPAVSTTPPLPGAGRPILELPGVPMVRAVLAAEHYRVYGVLPWWAS